MVHQPDYRFPSVLGALLVIALSACTEVRLISDYDAYTDEAISQLQHDVELFLTSTERTDPPDCAYDKHSDFYTQATADINVLIVRNELRPKNSITSRQLELLASSFKDLEALDQEAQPDCMGADSIDLLRSTFGSQFGAILKLEMAKRRGETDAEES